MLVGQDEVGDVRPREADRAQREAAQKQAEAWRKADPTRAPAPVYLGAEVDIEASSLSPNGRWLLVVTRKKGADAGPNPWNARGLEWETPSPPPTANFDVIPTVTREPYDYYEHALDEAAKPRPSGAH